MRRALRPILILLVVAALATAGAAWYLRSSDRPPQYRTAPVRRDTIVQTISSTGTAVPEDVIDVGAQVNGPVASFGVDKSGKPIDYRSDVEEGMVLAKIDETIYAADVASADAQNAQAQAQVRVATANRSQAEARLLQATLDWERAQRLGPSAALAKADYDAAQSAFEQAKAAVAVAEASIGQANAQVASAAAVLERAKHNLAYCTITSPVAGVIIDKKVEIGQTVVASFNAPSLFLIAKDLKRMQVLVQVNEADIGSVTPGQTATFTCDAFPNHTFKGTVRKVRLNATMTQNVVTYTVEIVTDNSDLRLLPYLTANVKFVVATREDVLAVPNAALRFMPRQSGSNAGGNGGGGAGPGDATQPTPANPPTDRLGRSGPPGNAPTQGGATREAAPASGGARQGGAGAGGSGGREGRIRGRATVWVLDAGSTTPRPVEVQAGISDGALTEVSNTDLKEGDQVIVGEVVTNAPAGAAGQTTNPFQPQFPGRGGGGGGGGRRG